MIWDPSNLEIHTISPVETASNELKVQFTLAGTGLDTTLVALLVSHETRDVIPCNDFNLTVGNSQGTFVICPNGKAAGYYDLVAWLPPPPSVTDEAGQVVPGVPVNPTYVLKKALHVVRKPKRTKG
jgi:hypothetical protein